LHYSNNSRNVRLIIKHKEIFDVRLKNSHVLFFKLSIVFLVLTVLLFSEYTCYQKIRESKLLESTIHSKKSEIQLLKRREKRLEHYKKIINSLFGYDIYENYVKNNNNE